MVDISTKIAGTARKLRATFYTGGEDERAELTTELPAPNSNVRLEAKQTGILGNDISISYIDTGAEVTDFSLNIKNEQDIVITLERDCSRASLETRNAEVESNIKISARAIGDAGNDISIEIKENSSPYLVIEAFAIASKICTVTSTAHGLVVGDIVGIDGIYTDPSLNGCYQVATVPNANAFTITLLNARSETTANGFMRISKLSMTVSGNEITVLSPRSLANVPMLDPSTFSRALSIFTDVQALISVEMVGDVGDKPIGFISKTHLTKGKDPAITTTALDVKRAIESHATAKNLVSVFIPEGTLGTAAVQAMPKTNLSGGSNLIKTDPDTNKVNVFIYDEWENVIATSDVEYIAEHAEENIDLIAAITRESLGVYSCVYAPNQTYRTIFAEFKATINDFVVLSRQRIDLDWALSDLQGIDL